MTERTARGALDAAHHLLWLAADDAGATPVTALGNDATPEEACATLAEECDAYCEPRLTDAERVVAYLRAAIDLLNLAEADAYDRGTLKAIAKATAKADDALRAALGVTP